MLRLCIFVGTFVLGYAGWWLGDVLGWSLLACYALSGVGSVVGVWLGWKVARLLDS